MFDETDSEIVDLNEKPRQSLIPDPEGDEMRNIAKLKGFTAVRIMFKSLPHFIEYKMSLKIN